MKNNKGPFTHLVNQRACLQIVYFDLWNKENHLRKRSRSAVLDPGLGMYRYNPSFGLLSPTTELMLLSFADEEIVVPRDNVTWPVPSVESRAQIMAV